VVAAVIAGLTVNAAADQQRAANNAAIIPEITAGTSAPPTSAAPPVSKPPTEDLAESPPPDRTRATFAGRVDDGGGTLAISLRDGVAIAYICDGKRVEAWLKGTAANGKLTLTGKGGAKIDGTFDSRRARGEVTAKGRTNTFDIAVAKKPSGLYRAAARVRNAEVVGSWIVLADGSQVGVLTENGVPGPAPALDVTGRATTVDGTRVTASTIDVDTGEGF
jgi:serine/threonine-protein kinase